MSEMSRDMDCSGFSRIFWGDRYRRWDQREAGFPWLDLHLEELSCRVKRCIMYGGHFSDVGHW